MTSLSTLNNGYHAQTIGWDVKIFPSLFRVTSLSTIYCTAGIAFSLVHGGSTSIPGGKETKTILDSLSFHLGGEPLYNSTNGSYRRIIPKYASKRLEHYNVIVSH